MQKENQFEQPKVSDQKLYDDAVKNLKSAQDLEKSFEAKLKEVLQDKPETHGALRSALQFAVSNGVAATETAGDYLLEVADYLEKKRICMQVPQFLRQGSLRLS